MPGMTAARSKALKMRNNRDAAGRGRGGRVHVAVGREATPGSTVGRDRRSGGEVSIAPAMKDR